VPTGIEIPAETLKSIRGILAPLLHSSEDRQPFLLSVFGQCQLIDDVDYSPKTPSNFIDRLSIQLAGFGDFEGLPALWVLLRSAKEHLGTNYAPQIDSLRPHIYALRGTSVNNLHILTSVKGGVGKTLLTLGVVCHYLDKRHITPKLVSVDINTNNNDLYRLLAGPNGGEALEATRWRYAKIGRSPHRVAKRLVPYQLLHGATGFWAELEQIVNHDDFYDFDAIVDTNMHIANLVELEPRIGEILRQICVDKNHKNIYIWIVWTFASLKDHEYVEKGVSLFKETLPQEVSDRITIVHVLNPSALAAPQNNFQDEIEAIVGIRRAQEKFDQLIEEMDRQNDPVARDAIRRLRENYMFNHVADLNLENIDLTVARAFPGLDSLSTAPVTHEIDYSEFIEKIGQKLTDGSNEFLTTRFTDMFESSFRDIGRPWNLLPISIHDPGLRGYTEVLSKLELSTLCQRMEHIQPDIERFLGHLNFGDKQ
jgi:hypothetical protein